MNFDNQELMKLFDFILMNKNIIIDDNNLFNRDFLIMIRNIIKGKIPNKIKLTKNQEQLLIDIFINENNIFNEDTPSFIIKNTECIKLSLARDINSIKYVEKVDFNLEKYIINNLLKKDFILKEDSPSFLKKNFSIALNSIHLDCLSADFIEWESMNEFEINKLIDEILVKGYVLSKKSCNFLKDNKKVVLHSIKIDKNNILYASRNMKVDFEIFKNLMLESSGNFYSISDLKQRELNYFNDSDILKLTLKRLDKKTKYNDIYLENFTKIYTDALNNYPTIKKFEKIFQTVALNKWKTHKEDYRESYDNIFGRICTELRNNSDFNYALSKLYFLEEMSFALGIEKYEILYQAMNEYFNIFHSNIDNKLEKLEKSKDIIANTSALYISICKEDYTKEVLIECYSYIEDYFKLRLEHPYINKKLIYSSQKEKFKNLYKNKNQDICNFIDNIIDKYSKFIDYDLVKKMVDDFIFHNCKNIDELILIPYNYDDYKRYEKAIKLINRLNSSYIKYDDKELINYKDIISYDLEKEKYIYTGELFNEVQLKEFNEFRKQNQIFKNIKKDISKRIKLLDFDNTYEYDEEFIENFKLELPFTDEYFIFDYKYVLKKFSLYELIESSMDINSFDPSVFIIDKYFLTVYNLLVNNGLIWLLLFENESINSDLRDNGINKNDIIELINNIKNIIRIAKELKIDIDNFYELSLLHTLSKYTENKSFAILGKEIVEQLLKHMDYTSYEEKEIIDKAKDLICQMVSRDKTTVPFISGKTMNYHYSLYDSQDASILLSGINTDSCFRIEGVDNDFLHYCALDKNGFVIKITDNFGDFIAKASGFRNGNCVLINQLRTIYDDGGGYYKGKSKNERKDIIETFQKACIDIVDTSLKNDKEQEKIDFVFVTKSYSMKYYPPNVSDDIITKIGNDPMDMQSDDWKKFIDNTKNLTEATYETPFPTDYGEYPLICIASSKKIEKIKPSDIIFKDVPALYERKRNKILITNNIDTIIYQKINRISAIKAFYDNKKFTSIEIPSNSTILIGDNWYIIYHNGSIIKSCLLDFDPKARIELEASRKVISQYKLNNNQDQLDIKEVSNSLEKNKKLTKSINS